MPAADDRTPVLFLHGFWPGSWCWTEVLADLTGMGVRALAVDMAGHGMRASRETGALRMDVASPDPDYREAVRATFYGDVDPAAADAARTRGVPLPLPVDARSGRRHRA